MKDLSHKIEGVTDSIFGLVSKMAIEHNAINLGQGFPDFDGENWIKEILNEKVNQGFNQYAPFSGTAYLRDEVSKYYKKFYGLNYDPENQITITVGATEAIYLAINSIISPGDEVIVLEPFYDSYVASIKMAGGIPVAVTMHGPDFIIDNIELEKSISPRTKLLILNNPHNPTGKVWKKEELVNLCNIAIKHDLYVISDEVYEFLVYDNNIHIPLAKIEGMLERTITISSAGKTFGLTGWKIGWICAHPKITKACRVIHQYVTFCVSTPIQEAVAQALKSLPEYLPRFVSLYQGKRDYFYQGLKQLGFDFSSPQGTYFMMVPIHHKTKLNDIEYAMKLIKERKVATVPPSAFYLKSNEGERYLRFCFAKKEDTLRHSIDQLKGL